MWHNSWSEYGPLKKFVSNRKLYDARIADYCCVAGFIDNNKCRWSEDWVKGLTGFRDLGPALINDEMDNVKWRSNNGQLMDFSMNTVWRDLKTGLNNVKWW